MQPLLRQQLIKILSRPRPTLTVARRRWRRWKLSSRNRCKPYFKFEFSCGLGIKTLVFKTCSLWHGLDHGKSDRAIVISLLLLLRIFNIAKLALKSLPFVVLQVGSERHRFLLVLTSLPLYTGKLMVSDILPDIWWLASRTPGIGNIVTRVVSRRRDRRQLLLASKEDILVPQGLLNRHCPRKPSK